MTISTNPSNEPRSGVHPTYHHPSPEQTESHLTELFQEEEQGYHKGLRPVRCR